MYIIGFAKMAGDLIDGLGEVMGFFLIAAGVATLIIFMFTRCLRSTVLVLGCSLIAVIWQLGIVVEPRLRARSVLDSGPLPGLRHRRLARRAEDERHHAGRRPRHPQVGGRALYLPPPVPGRSDGAAGRCGRLRRADGDRHPGDPRTGADREPRRGGADLHQPASCCRCCCRTSASARWRPAQSGRREAKSAPAAGSARSGGCSTDSPSALGGERHRRCRS